MGLARSVQYARRHRFSLFAHAHPHLAPHKLLLRDACCERHAWAEAFVPDLGWVGFDPANGFCTTDAHARVAIGLDYLGAAPVRGTRYGGGTETLMVTVKVEQAGGRQGQWQSQS